MKKLIALSAIFFAVVLTSNVFAQNTATATSQATAKIITKITLTNSAGLNFGTIAQTTAGGTVTIPANSDEAIYSNSQSKINSSTESRSQFDVEGEPEAHFSIVLPTAASTLTRVSGTETMTVNAFSANESLTNSQLGTNGKASFKVGATLNVAGSQVPGVYNGTYDVTVSYN